MLGKVYRKKQHCLNFCTMFFTVAAFIKFYAYAYPYPYPYPYAYAYALCHFFIIIRRYKKMKYNIIFQSGKFSFFLSCVQICTPNFYHRLKVRKI